MKLEEKRNIIMKILNKNFPVPEVPLNHKDEFTLLIAVLLSAQCTDERVNQVTPSLFAIADNPRKMESLSENQIYHIVRPCGLGPQKAKAISLLSKIIMEKHEGKVPKTLKELESLPGVGHKTASVVMSQAFGFPMFPVDTHIHRLAQRWQLTNGKNVTQTEKDLKRIFPESSWNKLHLQIIFWGRMFCQASKCFAMECEICTTINPDRKRPFKHKRP
jgi:endonuclease-3